MCKCSVREFKNNADYLVLLIDYYADTEEFFVEIDNTCPLLCNVYKTVNEQQAQGVSKARGTVEYPYSNRNCAQGVTMYRPLLQIKNLIKGGKRCVN